MALANWQLAVWFIMLGIYMTVCQVIHHRLLALIGSIKTRNEKSGFTSTELIEWIPKKHDEHVKLAEMIHVADEVFQVYVFAMLATNIPTTIFTLLAFLQRWKVSWIDAAFSVPEIGLCLFQLTALTLTPDRIHRAVRAPARIMHASAHLWTPYNENVYHVLSVFVNNSSLSEVGISIWGFALVTKSVILTIISLATTYLTVLMEFQNGDDCGTKGTTDTHNITSVS
ncbi:GUR-4 protein [Aphelenchoides avenae]|nr:GUR-4 protein [Aphelenchus avenae]KAH7705845.1 GUR-4 protein [Aphelenchus avenae]